MIEKIFKLQTDQKSNLKNTTPKERVLKLNKIYDWIFSNRENIKAAIYADFNKSSEETDLTEVYPVLSEIKHAKRNISKWMKLKKAKKTFTLFTHSAYTNYEAKGIILIISPWNFPFLLTIGPLISALTAGNAIIIKPSEISVNTSILIARMISELFPENEVAVIQGDKEIVSELLTFPFDHIFFTGSTLVGKIIAKSASENLTSCTLELGGKSPVIIDHTADLKSAVEKIVWGKFINKGQTCVAPDYILIDRRIKDEFIKLLIEQIKLVFGKDTSEIQSNQNYPRIINGHHHNRLVEMVENAVSNGSSVIYGGKHDEENRFIEPTLILTSCRECKISEDEIFGPLLPIIEFKNIDDALEWVNSRNAALALYIFSRNNKTIKKITSKTVSGGVGINEVVLQFGHQHLPFGGVKHSGIGRSHGFFGFKEFSNERSYIKSGRINLLKLIYPPYTNFKKRIIDIIVRYL